MFHSIEKKTFWKLFNNNNIYYLCSAFPCNVQKRITVLYNLRAPDCKYQKSYDRREISDFILINLNVPFGELFSKKYNKKSRRSFVFLKIIKINLRLHAHLSPLGKWEDHASLPSSHFAMETIPVILPRLQVNLSIISR